MPALFDHVGAASSAGIDGSSNAFGARTSIACEDERGAVYVLNARGELRSALGRDLVRYAHDPDFDGTEIAVTKHAIAYERAFTAERACVSASGRHCCVSGERDEGSGARATAACYVACLSAGSTRSTMNESASASDGVSEERQCVAVGVCEEEFEAVPSVRVARCEWHPSADSTLAMLTTDGVFRLINCDDIAGGGVPVVERCWRLDLTGTFPEASPLRPDVVDFAFAPKNAWGAFTVYFLAKSGDVHAMCPVVPRGAKYPRVMLKTLKVKTEKEAEWLSETFPNLGDAHVPMLTAHVKREEGRPVALQGPLPRTVSLSSKGTTEGDDALSLAVSPPLYNVDGGGTMATLHASAVHVHVIPCDVRPSWCDGPHKNMRGYTYVMSDSFSSAPDLPTLLTVDTIRLSAVPGEQSLAKVKFADVSWDPALRERIFVCVNGNVHSIVLTWLPTLEAAIEDAVDENHPDPEALPMPQVTALCDYAIPFAGIRPLGDPLAEGVVVAIRNDGAHRMLIPPPVSVIAEANSSLLPYSPSTSAIAVQPQTLEAGSRSELQALSEGIQKDRMKSIEQIMQECGVTSDMKTGDPGSNEALAKCASSLKEIYVDYARDVHDEVRTTSLRLTAEIKRQKEEVTALLASANDAVERHNALVERVESAAKTHKNIRERLRTLAEKEKTIPHPLSKAEKLLKAQMEAFEADLPLLKQRVDELKERAAIATERDDDDIGYVGSRRVGAAANGDSVECGEEERKVSKALAAQDEMIKENAAKAKLLEELLEEYL